MNVRALQLIDRWLGVPLCFVLTVVRVIFGRRPPVCFLPPRRILFVKLAEQGSTVLASLALRRAVEIAGRENVYFITLDDNRFILDLLGIIPEQNVITVSFKNFSEIVLGGLSAIRRLRALKLDAAVDMEFFSRGSAALAFLSSARSRAGFHPFFGAGPYRGDLMTHRLLYNSHIHTSQTFLTLVEAVLRDPAILPALDLPPPTAMDEPEPFVPLPGEVTEVREILCREADANPLLILINPNASDLLPLRRWPNDRYLALARRLVAKYPEIYVAITGAPAEAEAAAELVRQVASDRCFSLAGKTTLRQLLVLYTLSEVLVTNDSGPAHFATLTPVRVVTLFGPETPALFAARTPRNTVLWAGIVCSPCVNAYNNRQSPCLNNLCMQAITVDQVFAEVCRALEVES
ncbi:MAG TPA: glycosyltransferase family 9 protein [Geobacteraceae bacterium]|nr:glycosyltransferase family 9 protein [Geobacteraceae bacterium]